MEITDIQLLIYNNDFERLIFFTDKTLLNSNEKFRLYADVERNNGVEISKNIFNIEPQIVDLRFEKLKISKQDEKEGGVMIYDKKNNKFIKDKS